MDQSTVTSKTKPKFDKHADLRHLHVIQELDSRILELSKRVEAIPKEIEQLEASYSKHKSHLNTLMKENTELKTQQAALELEVSTRQEKIKKYEQQLYSIKKNVEYQALLVEIESLKIDISRAEDKILDRLENIEAHNKSIKEAEKQVTAENAQLNEKKKVMLAELADLKSQIAKLEQQKKEIAPKVERSLFQRYEKVRRNKRDGAGLVEMKNDFCTGCHMQLPPQLASEVIAGDRVIACQSCMRILYYEPNIKPGVTAES